MMVNAGKWLRNLLLGKKKDAGTKQHDSPDGKPKEKKKEKRRWSFGRAKERVAEASTKNGPSHRENMSIAQLEEEQNKHAMAVAAATAAAAEAAVAAAQAAAAVVRLTNTQQTLYFGGFTKEEWAAIRIQAAFRGYLARRALRALKGLVKLQALVRGHIVRKQAAVTLRCMQALVRVQARVRARRVRMSEEGQVVQRQLQQRRQHENRPRKSVERWNGTTSTIEELEARHHSKHVGALKRERAMAYSFSQQLKKCASSRQNSLVIDCEPDKPHWGWSWLDRWMAARPWESPFLDELANGDSERTLEDSAKIVEMDTGRPKVALRKRTGSTVSEPGSIDQPSISSTPSAFNNTAFPSPYQQQFKSHAPVEAAMTAQLSGQLSPHPAPCHSPPSPGSDSIAAATLHEVRPSRSWYARGDEDSTLTTAQSSPRATAGKRSSSYGMPKDEYSEASYYDTGFPSYMSNTQSSKAKVRSQSAPKQRPDPSEKPAKKRFSLHDAKGFAAPARMQRSSSQVRASSKGYNGSTILDRSTTSLRDSEIGSADLRRPFR